MTEQFIAYVATARYGAVSAERLADAIRMIAAPMALAIQPLPSALPASALGPGFVLEVEGLRLAVMFVAAPLPREAYAEALTLNRTWPEAAAAMDGAAAHVIVASLSPPGSHGEALNAAGYASFAAAALCTLLPAIAVVWTNASTMTEANAFQTAIRGLGQRRLPVLQWVGLSFLQAPAGPQGERQTAVMTHGLLPFLGRELEWMPSPLPLPLIVERLLGACDYLIMRGPVIADGDTLGVSTTERIRARYAAQGQRPGVPVMQLSAERIEPTQPQSSERDPWSSGDGPGDTPRFGRKGVAR